ncbi:MAG: STAS domain-containing protein [Nitrospiria bacterium]
MANLKLDHREKPALNIKVRHEGNGCVLEMSGRFDFSGNKLFRKAYESGFEKNASGHIDLNLRGVDYLDSSALGMLLLLKEKADAKGGAVFISKCSDPVREILKVVNFNKLFDVEAGKLLGKDKEKGR